MKGCAALYTPLIGAGHICLLCYVLAITCWLCYFYVPNFSFQVMRPVMGHSYVLGGKTGGCSVRSQLGVPREVAMVHWFGVPGMLWSRVLPEIHKYAHLDRALGVLVLHVGGNDLGIRSMRYLIRDIKFDVLRIRTDFPHTFVVWSDRVGRTAWRWARSVDKVSKARIKVNKEVGRLDSWLGTGSWRLRLVST